VGSTKYRLRKLEDDSDDFTNKDWNRIVALTESSELESWASSKTSAVLVAYDSLWLERNEDVLSYLMASVVTYDEPPSTDITKLYHFCQPKDNVLQVAQDLLRQLSSGMALNSMATAIEQAVSQLVSRLRQLQSTHKVVLFIDGSNARSLDIRQLIMPLYKVVKDDRENNRLGFKLFLIVADRQGWDFRIDDMLCNEVPAEGDREAECYEAYICRHEFHDWSCRCNLQNCFCSTKRVGIDIRVIRIAMSAQSHMNYVVSNEGNCDEQHDICSYGHRHMEALNNAGL
jgi:hypothetical protein